MMAAETKFQPVMNSHKEIAMQAVEVQKIVPTKNENAEATKVPPQEQPVKKDEFADKGRQIRNISAFCDCV